MENKIIKYSTEKATKQDKRVLRFIGSDEKIDRDGDKIITDKWNLTEYRKNPVVLFGHDYTGAPVAKTKKVWIENKQLKFDIEFPESDVSSVGDSLYKLYKNGFMNATSVGFMPDFTKITYPKKANQPQRIYNGQTLLEISLVSVPSNARALLTSKSIKEAIDNNVIDQLELDELIMYCDEDKCELKTKEEIEEIDYKQEIKDLQDEMKSLKEQSYIYRLFDDYKKEVKENDDVYEKILKQLKS